MPARGIERSSEVVGALRRLVIGMPKQWLSDADMLRVVNGQLGRNQLAKEVRIEIPAELAFCYAADDSSHFLCGQRLAGEADPERVAGHRRCRAHHEKRAVALEVAVNQHRQAGQWGLEVPPVLHVSRTECSPPFSPAPLQGGADRHRGQVLGADRANGKDGEHQGVPDLQSTPPIGEMFARLCLPGQIGIELRDRCRRHQACAVIACRRAHTTQP